MLDEKFRKIEQEYLQINADLGNQEIISNTQKLRELSIRRKELLPVYEKLTEYDKTEKELAHVLEISKSDDPDMALLAKEEIPALEEKRKILFAGLEEFLKPKDPLDRKDVIVEIRAAAGGEESSLFASELYRMYSRYGESKKMKISLLESSSTDLGGVKEIIFSIEGAGAYGLFKYESGTHRVQRVPQTEASGRIHTSTTTVAILVEPEDVEIDINPGDLKVDTYRAGGHGGQYLQKTDSAVRITHIPTNLVVACQDERSQLKNKLKAMKILKARLYDLIKKQQQDKIAKDRKKQIGTGDRSEKIRTYNFPQDRITDHRINENWHNIQSIMDGNLDDVVKKLKEAEIFDESDGTFKIGKSPA